MEDGAPLKLMQNAGSRYRALLKPYCRHVAAFGLKKNVAGYGSKVGN